MFVRVRRSGGVKVVGRIEMVVVLDLLIGADGCAFVRVRRNDGLMLVERVGMLDMLIGVCGLVIGVLSIDVR